MRTLFVAVIGTSLEEDADVQRQPRVRLDALSRWSICVYVVCSNC
jgi:hypothetical protein